MDDKLLKGFEIVLYRNGVILSLLPLYLLTFGTFLGIMVSINSELIFYMVGFSIEFSIAITLTVMLTMFAFNKRRGQNENQIQNKW